MDPIRVLLRSGPSGDKTFSKFQKGLSPPFKFETPRTVSYTNKWKKCQVDPLGAASAASFRGIKHFQGFFLASFRS